MLLVLPPTKFNIGDKVKYIHSWNTSVWIIVSVSGKSDFYISKNGTPEEVLTSYEYYITRLNKDGTTHKGNFTRLVNGNRITKI